MEEETFRFLEIRIPKDNEYTVEQTQALLSNLSLWKKSFLFLKKPLPVSLEIACIEQKIYFIVGVPTAQINFFQSQVLAQYKDCLLTPAKDYLASLNRNEFSVLRLSLARPWYLPLKTADQFDQVDPLSSVLATMAKNAKSEDIIVYQLLLLPVSKGWQANLINFANAGGGKDENGRALAHPQKSEIELKAAHAGFCGHLRIFSNNSEALSALSGSFGAFASSSGNYLTTAKPGSFSKKKWQKAFFERKVIGKGQILNDLEISSLWHLPTALITLPNIAWGRKIVSEAPENLPIAEGLGKEEKQQITFIAQTEYKNQLMTFGIKRKDRSRHVYTIGKSGTGKTTLVANMAIEDIRKGEGVGVVDPHGDLMQILLQYIPKNRINDVCYFNPSDPEYTYPLNPLEVNNPSQRELVASGIVSIFYKLYGDSWGPRLEHILRNCLLSLTAVPDTTLGDVIRILTDRGYRQKIVEKLDDRTLKAFWEKEFQGMGDRLRAEAISPILNKVGQFVTSPLIRQVLAYPKSRVKIEEIMNQGKILLVDLSSGKIGEDNSALLGAMIITQIQLAAMNRVYTPEEKRRDFYLYVDEFQNFATRAFIKILSEARKFKLNLTVANQYMAQLDEEVQKAILGNVGSIITFLVGSNDAQVLDKEFGKDFTPDDLVSLGRFQILMRLAIDWQTSNPFYAVTLPLPDCVNKNREKIIKMSQMQFGRKKS
ncbi:MAG: type IV secretion system DNA-binding domain-containing protein [Candidatus Shapirobacteria bacterium]